MYKTLHKKQGSVTVQLRFARSSVTFCAKRDSNAVNTLTGKYSGYCGIFAGDDTNGYRFIVGSVSCNCQELADRMRRELSAKGGGSAPMIQGNVAVTADTLQTMWASL